MKISVIIPLYNAEKYIGEALESLINQTYSLFEIIVVDDCSKDRAVEIVEYYKNNHHNIRLIKQETNKGVSAARNEGIKEARGDWILFLDADDICDELIVNKYIEILNENSCEMIYSNYVQIDENGLIISQPIKGLTLRGNNGFCDMILRNPIISPSGVMISKDILIQLKGFDESMTCDEDVDLWLRLLLNNKKIIHVDINGSKIRRHSSNTTNSIEVSNKGEKTLIKKYGLAMLREIFYQQDKDFVEKKLGYINMLIRFEEYRKAYDLISEIIINKEHPKYISYCFMKGIICLELLDYTTAESTFEEILGLEPLHGSSLNNLGVLNAMNYKKDKAKQLFEKSMKLYPGYIDAAFNLENLESSELKYRFTKRELRKNLLRYS